MFRASAETPSGCFYSSLPSLRNTRPERRRATPLAHGLPAVSTASGDASRRRRRSVGARHELRAWLSRDTYDRLSREASARHATLSHCVRECLDEYFGLKQEIASALTPSSGDAATSAEGMRLAHALLDENARRIVSEIERRDARLETLLDQIRRVGCMVDRAYLGLVARLPDIEPRLRAARLAEAEEKTRRWRRIVREMHAAGEPENAE